MPDPAVPLPGSRGEPVMELAVQDDYVLGGGGRLDAARAYELVHAAGITVARVNVLSSEVAKDGFRRLDALVDRIRMEGLIPQLTIMGRPRWYVDNAPDGGCPHIDPDPAKYAAFCTTVVQHFGSRVGRYSIWNEPDHPTFLQSTHMSTARLYAQLYRAGFAAIRRRNPKAVVLWGEIAGGANSRQWVDEALREGYVIDHKPVVASGFAIHPYQYLTDPGLPSNDSALRFGDLAYLKWHLAHSKFLTTTLGRPCPIYITEMGWFNPPHKLGIPDDRRAKYLIRALKIARDLGVRQFLYFTLAESPASPEHPGGWDTGIVHLDGSTSKTYDALRGAL